MARIREALRRADAVHGRPADGTPAPRPYQPDDEEQLRPQQVEEEVPFIEVGGRQTPMEGSPSVLAGSSKLAYRSQGEQPGRSEPDDPGRPRATVSAASPVRLTGVAFRPVPAELPPPRPLAERFAPGLVALHQPDHPVSEQYRALVKDLERQLPAGQPQVLLFTAPAPQTDTTTVLLNLAITGARQDATRIIVVDADLRRPAVAERLGLPPGPGLGDVLAGKLPLPRALQETGQANLYALTAGKATDGNSPLPAGEAMRAVLRHLRDRFAWVFVDAPCWDGGPEVATLGSACDGVYLVLPESTAESADVADLLELIPQQGGRLRGCILTRTE